MLEETRRVKRVSKVGKGKWAVSDVEQTLTVADERVTIHFKFHTKETDREPLVWILGERRYPDYALTPEEIDEGLFNANPYNLTYNKFFGSIFGSEFESIDEES